ncbi:hypothetical protein CRENPOLYSF2_1020012 [Crenothrix polyspora]|uniref:Uncharacterized protein n=1 Tax=Crenothrix polyspora TaxID=360316 RepID=A0A1R4GYK6_9GAMM|nr:hypothetical protein CRENPOLYSF2_1020012 [Crenothrix polyspora]
MNLVFLLGVKFNIYRLPTNIAKFFTVLLLFNYNKQLCLE